MPGTRETEFEQVVERFYEAAAVPSLWPKALQSLAHACGAQSACAMPVSTLDPLGPIVSTEGGDYAHDFLTTWSAPERNTRMPRCMSLVMRGWRGLITEQDAFTREELAKDPLHNEFVLHHGYSSFAGAVVASTPDAVLPISLERRIDQGPFTRAEIARINRLYDLIAPAASIALQMGLNVAEQVAHALDRIGHAAALVGQHGRIVRMNARFDGLIGRGFFLRHGRIGSDFPQAESELAAAIHRAVHFEASSDPSAPIVLPRHNGRRPLIAHVAPLFGAAEEALLLARAIVLLTDLEDGPPPPSTSVIQRVFGLTPAEARLAARIASGETLNDSADAEGITRETARSRIKAIFEKTGTRRQTELALLIARVANGSF